MIGNKQGRENGQYFPPYLPTIWNFPYLSLQLGFCTSLPHFNLFLTVHLSFFFWFIPIDTLSLEFILFLYFLNSFKGLRFSQLHTWTGTVWTCGLWPSKNFPEMEAKWLNTILRDCMVKFFNFEGTKLKLKEILKG